ncbi:hypothetical protein FXO38_29596 [Capsicum annuum]|nr:hypothetical protein FXO38_29596 [Capsicum annuum]KAF3626764.1 hypothetical protein FXO37_30223 [Capsicum annuum]
MRHSPTQNHMLTEPSEEIQDKFTHDIEMKNCKEDTGMATEDPLLMKAARKERVSRPPAWKMRQAERYMAIYRNLAEKHTSFRERSETPKHIEEISLQSWEAFHLDGVGEQAAILGFVGAPLPITTYIVNGDPCEDEFLPKYYHKNDLALVIGMMKSSEIIYGTILRVILKLPNTNCMATGSKHNLDSQLKTMSSNFPVLIMSQHKENVNEKKQEEKLSSCSDDVGYGESETVDPSMKMRNMLPGLKELQRQRKFHQLEGQNRKITLHQPPWSMEEFVNPILIASQLYFSIWVDILIVDELMQPLVDEAMLSGYSCREKWIPAMGVLCYGPPGTGKTFLTRAVVNCIDACFIRVIGSELVQKYVREGARMVRELFQGSPVSTFICIGLIPGVTGYIRTDSTADVFTGGAVLTPFQSGQRLDLNELSLGHIVSSELRLSDTVAQYQLHRFRDTSSRSPVAFQYSEFAHPILHLLIIVHHLQWLVLLKEEGGNDKEKTALLKRSKVMGMGMFQAENGFKVLNPGIPSSKIFSTGQARVTRLADITDNIGYTPTSTSKLKWNGNTAISTKKLQEIKEKKRKKNVGSSSNNPSKKNTYSKSKMPWKL